VAPIRRAERAKAGGMIRVIPGTDGSLWAEYGLHVRALLRTADEDGSGGRIWAVPPVPQSARLK
jgi:hypothetical protein